MAENKIKYYLVKQKTNSGEIAIGKQSKEIPAQQLGWWYIKEFGFLEKRTATAKKTTMQKRFPNNEYSVHEVTMETDTREELVRYFDRFIKGKVSKRIEDKLKKELDL